ncbi:hybrid sensor histidine kinase/response regulator [Gemmatimonadetes bacterium T265]|nr:hybrid sensor histidine kinase/response regulator [Gemmatimonadetes bacterium T265]
MVCRRRAPRRGASQDSVLASLRDRLASSLGPRGRRTHARPRAHARCAWRARLAAAAGFVSVVFSTRPTAAAQTSGSADALPGASPYVERMWRTDDGLPSNIVWAVTQTHDGYLWLGTESGLARFDGVSFATFGRPAAPDLAGRAVRALFEARDGTLWIGSEGAGVFRLRGGRVERPSGGASVPGGRVRAIVQDRSGVVWVGSDHGLIGVDASDHVVARLPPERLSPSPVSALAVDSSGTLWIGTVDGGLFARRGGGIVRHSTADGLSSNSIRVLAVDARGAVWIATWGAGLDRIAPDGGIHRYRATSPDGDRLRGLLVDRRGAVWAGAMTGLLQLPGGIDTGARAAAGGLAVARGGSRLTAVAEDRDGDLWLATYNDGLVRLRRDVVDVLDERSGLRSRNVRAVLEDSDGSLWIATKGGGLHRVRGGHLDVFTTRDGLLSDEVYSLHRDATGVLWVGTKDGLNRFDGTRFVALTTPPLRDAIITAIYRDGDGVVWTGTENAGLYRYTGGAFRPVADPRLTSSAIWSIQGAADGSVWIGTEARGLFRYRNGTYAPFPGGATIATGVRGMRLDADGALWVGTFGDGIARIRGERLATVTTTDGLADNEAFRVLDDGAGRLWMSSDRGLYYARTRDVEARLDGARTPIASAWYGSRREYNGSSQPSAWRGRDGRLFFASMAGLVIVDPHRLAVVQSRPHVQLEQVVAGARSVVPAAGGVRLRPRERDFHVDYTAPALSAPDEIRFRYRMAGYDRDWQEAGSRRVAYYTHVPPGHYTFEVVASHVRGEWAPVRAAVALDVAPYVYETWWFAATGVLAGGVLLLAGVRWREASLRARARTLERVVDERTAALRAHERRLAHQNALLERQALELRSLDRAKTRFFANVSHEFRTPLTLTIAPLEDLRARAGGDAQAERWLDLALRNARRLLRLVNQILDVAKLEAGQMRLAPRPMDLGGFVRGVAGAFESAAERRAITLEVDTPPGDVLRGAFDPDAVEKILTNLLSNAVKFTPEGGRVTVALARDGDAARLRVADTGRGFDADQLAHVFERFWQVDESAARTQPGTGIGLSLVKELVELHGGTITVASDGPGTGAAFTVLLPLAADPAALDAEPAPEPVRVGPGAPTVEFDGGDTAAVAAATAGNGPGADVPTLLVVDDSADLRAYVRDQFAGRFRVLEAGDGAAGVELARRHLPDVVLSDVMMPGTDGHALLRALRASPETDFLPVLLLTAQAEDEQRIAGLERGADDYLVKPFDARELRARVENVIASRRRLRERLGRAGVELPTPAPGLVPADRALVDRIRSAIEANLGDPEFGVAELAKAVAVERSHLFRRTREMLDATPSELLRRARLERAAQLLREGAGSVAEVAYAVGFQSVSHFSQSFREAHGVSPSQYREQPARG